MLPRYERTPFPQELRTLPLCEAVPRNRRCEPLRWWTDRRAAPHSWWVEFAVWSRRRDRRQKGPRPRSDGERDGKGWKYIEVCWNGFLSHVSRHFFAWRHSRDCGWGGCSSEALQRFGQRIQWSRVTVWNLSLFQIGVFKNGGTPIAGWFIMENLYPHFSKETSKWVHEITWMYSMTFHLCTHSEYELMCSNSRSWRVTPPNKKEKTKRKGKRRTWWWLFIISRAVRQIVIMTTIGFTHWAHTIWSNPYPPWMKVNAFSVRPLWPVVVPAIPLDDFW